MALRNLAMRTRNLTAAALRVLPPAPRVSPPAGTRPRFFSSQVEEERARNVLKDKMALFEEVKEHHAYMRSRIWWIQKGSKCLTWTCKLLTPVPVMVSVVKATR